MLLLLNRPASRYIPDMAQAFLCNLCEHPEKRCVCDKYCILCLGEWEVRLCQDGSYYCLACREACGYEAQYTH
jgi:hypothetical protein